MLSIRLIDPRRPTRERQIPHGRIKDFLLRLRMNHHIAADLLEQSPAHPSVHLRRHFQRLDHAAHHPMVLCENRSHPHRTLLDGRNQANQGGTSGNATSDHSPFHPTRSVRSSAHNSTSTNPNAVFVPLTIPFPAYNKNLYRGVEQW